MNDVFAVVKRENDKQILNLINNVSPHIKFTIELEKNQRLPILVLLIELSDNGKLAFDIYRKPTSTECFITNESHHQTSQLTVFQVM